MKKIIRLIKMLFCKHDFEYIRYPYSEGKVNEYKCKKCGARKRSILLP